VVTDCGGGIDLAQTASMESVIRRPNLDMALRPAIAILLAVAPFGFMLAHAQTDSRRPGAVPYLNFPPGDPLALTPSAPPTSGSAPASSAPALEALKKRDQELQAIQAEQKKTRANLAKIKREVDSIGDDRRKINRQLIEVAARVRDIETQIAAAEERIKPLDEKEAALRKSLESRREVTAKVLAAMQRIGRNPPPALIVSPEDALQSVRSALLLGAVLPEMRREVETLVADLAELARLRRDIAAERERLAASLTAISEDRTRLTLLIEQRRKQQTEAEETLAAERRRASELARQAESLQELIAKVEQGLDRTARGARVAVRGKDNSSATDGRPDLAALKDPGRLVPAVRFASAKRTLPLPVNGVRIREFNAPDGLGGREKGLSIATRPEAQITSPCDGWVVYSGPFRNYGQLLILNAGDGYHVLLAGMERISVDLGQFVVTGEPVAVMGGRAQAPAAIAIGSGQPVLYVEFRKDGTPIDPGPWWAASDSEKVRG
jgi:septal ring factor EnvC (AmiA/AmiB activator)